jgi:fumarylacetoacetase
VKSFVGFYDTTTDAALWSWVPVEAASDFPIQNLPLGVFATADGNARCGVAIGTQILDLEALARTGVLDGVVPGADLVFTYDALNVFLALGRPVWRAFRERISALLRFDADDETRELVGECLVPMADATMQMPIEVGDYVDFYSSIEHATNLGKILRPGGEALLPNYRHIPIGYHGRASSVIVSDDDVVRPNGQVKAPDANGPSYGPTRMLDIETEMGFVTGDGPMQGVQLDIDATREVVYGYLLLNDWSARDIQGWEYQPLGPFLSKSFATSISPWLVSLDALEPFRIRGPQQTPQPLGYLRARESWSYDIDITVTLQTEKMRAAQTLPLVISRTNLRWMYWNFAQQLAHMTVNGSPVRAGDLFGTGTISGHDATAYGSLIELTWRGRDPIAVGDEQRTFLEDGDTVVLSATCTRDGLHIGFGSVAGTILPAP